MAATDLDLARALLIANRDATLVAVRDDEVIICTERGIKPLLAWVREGRDLTGFSVADKVVGKAPALLYAVLGPDAVFSPIMSWTGRAVLLAASIATSYDTLATRPSACSPSAPARSSPGRSPPSDARCPSLRA